MKILVQFRCPELDGGDPKFTIIAPTINDTGSNVQSVHLSDWNALKTPAVELFKAQMLTAAGVRNVWNMFLEIRIVKPEYKKNAQNVEEVTGNFEPLTPWYLEMLRLVEDNEDLLSGETMRKYLYFATAPGNEKLYVSQKKNGIFKDLPVV